MISLAIPIRGRRRSAVKHTGTFFNIPTSRHPQLIHTFTLLSTQFLHLPGNAICPPQEIALQAIDSVGATGTAVLRFVVLPENDPPVLEMASATYDSSKLTHDGLSGVVESVDLLTVSEDKDTAIPGLSVRDVDLDIDGAYIFGGDPGFVDGGLVEITLYSSNGTTSLGAGVTGYTFLVGDGVGDGIMSFRASLAGANRALAGLTYRGKNDFYGTDDLVVTVDDGGGFGRGTLCEESSTLGGIELGDDYQPCPQVLSKLQGKPRHVRVVLSRLGLTCGVVAEI